MNPFFSLKTDNPSNPPREALPCAAHQGISSFCLEKLFLSSPAQVPLDCNPGRGRLRSLLEAPQENLFPCSLRLEEFSFLCL